MKIMHTVIPGRTKIVVLGIIVLLLVVSWLLPFPKALFQNNIHNVRIEDRYGQLLYVTEDGGLRDVVAYENIPRVVIDAVIATEDRSFWKNIGINQRGIARAIVHNIRAGRVVEGGSGLTQQFIRTRLQPKHRGFLYKIKEAFLAIKLTTVLSKNDILSEYLNAAFFGSRSYGITSAARTYFNTPLDRITLSEAALLVGLLNAPSDLNPLKNPKKALERRDVVLRAMVETGDISQSQFEEAQREELVFAKPKKLWSAPHFVTMLLESPSLPAKGTVQTSLDLSLQRSVEAVVTNQLQKLQDKNVTSAAVVVLDATNGDILALVGSADFYDAEHDGQVNVAIAERQPGSALKPFTYALFLNSGKTPATTVADVSEQYLTQAGNPYTPRNYDYEEHGLVRMREALANSYNIAAIKVLESIGVSSLYYLLRQSGISTIHQSPEHYGLALTLGDSEVKLLELVSAYSLFPRLGDVVFPRSVLSETIRTANTPIRPTTAWLITNILSDSSARLPEFGSDGPLTFDFPVAAKTGTTRNSRDNWTIGYTQNVIVGVWVGNANNEPMKGTSGITGAGPIFHDVMILADTLRPSDDFLKPEGIEAERVCMLSGMLPSKYCSKTVLEYFEKGTAPTQNDRMYLSISIDTRNGLRATSACEATYIENIVFTQYPRELLSWARENQIPEVPQKYSPFCLPDNENLSSKSERQKDSISITHPAQGSSFLLDPTVPDAFEKISFRAFASESVQIINWFVDGKLFATSKQPDFFVQWQPVPGVHTIEARAGASVDTVLITVAK